MRVLLFPVPTAVLLAATHRCTQQGITWYVDGNNVVSHKGTPRDTDAVAVDLQQIRGAEAVVLVLDGTKGQATETFSSEGTEFFQLSLLGEGISADDFIFDEIQRAVVLRPDTRVQVVTADRELRRRVLAIKPMVRDVVNPVTFWRRYWPRLCGLKKPK
jgi:hypothetical protein